MVIYKTRIADYDIRVERHGNIFTVLYGLQKTYCHSRAEAEKELASCIFHAIELEGKLD